MKLKLIILMFSLFIFSCSNELDAEKNKDKEEILKIIDIFQTTYTNKEYDKLKNLFNEKAIVEIITDKYYSKQTFDTWLDLTKKSLIDKDNISDKLENCSVESNVNVASAFCDYVYEDDTKVNKGNDVFTFIKINEEWKITNLLYNALERNSKVGQ